MKAMSKSEKKPECNGIFNVINSILLYLFNAPNYDAYTEINLINFVLTQSLLLPLLLFSIFTNSLRFFGLELKLKVFFFKSCLNQGY